MKSQVTNLQLQLALQRYGQHLRSCAIWEYPGAKHCDCGWSQTSLAYCCDDPSALEVLEARETAEASP